MTKLSQEKADFSILETYPQIVKGVSRDSLKTKSAGAKESGEFSFPTPTSLPLPSVDPKAQRGGGF
jgi:hypothetical protein